MLNQGSSIETIFRQQGLFHLAYNIITFIQCQTLLEVINFGKQPLSRKQKGDYQVESRKSQVSFSESLRIESMIKSYCFMKQYLCKADRSLYFSFYQSSQFITFQSELFQNVILQDCKVKDQNKKISDNFEQFQFIFGQIEKEGFASTEELEQLQRIFTDPVLPLPKIKRQNEGIYCKSNFQLFLVSKRFSHTEDQIDFGLFDMIKQKLENQSEKHSKQYFSIISKKQSELEKYKKIQILRYKPFIIDSINFRSYLLEQHILHNFIVYLLALTDIWIESIFDILIKITNPLYLLAEVLSRFGSFRSFILEIQENLQFLFKNYENLHYDNFKEIIDEQINQMPKFCYWRPAMTKWFTKMSHLIPKLNKIYFLVLTKMRENKVLKLIQGEINNKAFHILKRHQISLKNNIELNSLSSKHRTQVYSESLGQDQIQYILSSDSQICETLIMEYMQYLTDLSVNEETVHWCGHSEHALSQPFVSFKKQFLAYNQQFFFELQQLIFKSENQKEFQQTFCLFVKNDLQLLEYVNVKPIVLKSVIKLANQMLEKNDRKEIKKQGQQQLCLSDSNSFKSEQIFYNYKQNDQKLKFFNEKANILFSVEGQCKYLFQIPQDLYSENLLVKLKIIEKEQNPNLQGQITKSYEIISDFQADEFLRPNQNKLQQSNNLMSLSNKNSDLKSTAQSIKQQKQLQMSNLKDSFKNIDDQQLLRPQKELESNNLQSYEIYGLLLKNKISQLLQQADMQILQCENVSVLSEEDKQDQSSSVQI